MSIQQINKVLHHQTIRLSAGEFRVLIYIADRADALGEHSYPSLERLAGWTGMTREYVQQVVRRLTRRKCLERVDYQGRPGFRLTLPESTASEEEARRRRPLVYVIRLGDRIKIGHTSRLDTRVVTLSRNAGVKGELLAVVHAASAVEAKRKERALQNLCAASRIAGEWFRDEPALHAVLDDLAARSGIASNETILRSDSGSDDLKERRSFDQLETITRSSLENAIRQGSLPISPSRAIGFVPSKGSDPSFDPISDPKDKNYRRAAAARTHHEHETRSRPSEGHGLAAALCGDPGSPSVVDGLGRLEECDLRTGDQPGLCAADQRDGQQGDDRGGACVRTDAGLAAVDAAITGASPLPTASRHVGAADPRQSPEFQAFMDRIRAIAGVRR